MSSAVRVRFAPSPTGYLHVGGARTALFNWLYARHHGGTFVLRVEDTDKSREQEAAVQVIYDGLRWLGLDWDEGGDKGGPFGPYRQSDRGGLYLQYLRLLEANGLVYEDAGAVRFRSPRHPVVVNDEVCGRIEFDRTFEPDLTIRRPDGSWIFHFVNVVDDLEMQITHVIRGEDHLSNTAKHIELYHAFGRPPPRFAHIPLILNQDGSKMSKRDTGAHVGTYMEQGYAPEALRNYLCLLGWSPKDNREKIDIEEVIALFELDKINRRNAAFDPNKCFWLNGQYVHQMPLARFHELSLPFIHAAGIRVTDQGYLLEVLAIVKEKVKLFREVPEWISYFFTEDFSYDDASLTETLRQPGASERLAELARVFADTNPWQADALEAALKRVAAGAALKVGAFVHPARVAVSGRSVGPSLYHMLEVLGRERVLARMARAREHVLT
ncbi:MAG TPA: glutamate--tRNA ligase family protein [Chthoniobacterales bacterium]